MGGVRTYSMRHIKAYNGKVAFLDRKENRKGDNGKHGNLGFKHKFNNNGIMQRQQQELVKSTIARRLEL